MPYTWSKDSSKCPASKPYAVMNQSAPGKPGTTVVPGGCHKTKADALRHLRALYAGVPDAAAVAEVDRQLKNDQKRVIGGLAGVKKNP